jgi:hypothetical protein
MRNFFYNKSDILIAIIIIAVAAVIIWSRVNAIMDSGDDGKESQVVNAGDQVVPDVESTGGAVTDEQPTGEEQTSEGEQTTEEGEGTTEDETSDDEPADDKPVKFTVEIGSSASVVADDLEAAGLVESADAFLKELKSQNAETKLKAGTFKIKPGTAVTEIVKKLTN